MSLVLGRRVSDEQLGRRLAEGDASAFDELYRRYAHRLAAYGTHLLGDAAAGDDVAQVALMRAYQALRDGRVPEALGAWLYRVAHNAAVDVLRSRRDLPAEFPLERGYDQRSGGEAGALVTAIAALPERQRTVFALRELNGLRVSEVAAQLGLSSTQVEQALFAARNRLAEQLVFGERLSCAAVQQLAAGPLEGRERRALKAHVRSCQSCRRQLGVRGVALSLPLPASPFAWLRAALGGFGAPAAAKIGVAAAIVAGVPLAETIQPHHALGVRLPPAHRTARATVERAAAAAATTIPVRAVAAPVRRHVTARPSHVAPVPVAAPRAPSRPSVLAVPVVSLPVQPLAPASAAPAPAAPTAASAPPAVTTTTTTDAPQPAPSPVPIDSTDPGSGGGDTSSTGGDTSSTGGDTSSTGGDTSSTGGDTSSTGGDTSSTGGDTTSTGGDTSSGGGDSSGGSGGGSGDTGGSTDG